MCSNSRPKLKIVHGGSSRLRNQLREKTRKKVSVHYEKDAKMESVGRIWALIRYRPATYLF